LGGHGFSRAESASETWALAPEAFSQYCVEIGQNGEGGPYLTGRLNTTKVIEKNEAPAWDRGPRRVRFVVSVVFTPTRGVIHPSFPLRGRWERIAKSGEQAPSPSLTSLLNSSCETHSCTSLVQGLRQMSVANNISSKSFISKYLTKRRSSSDCPVPFPRFHFGTLQN
jgi:hypothetical protein